ncbi:ComEA family DNA-binding protein [Streptomyces sp. NPDC051214]|uniref:ComEA family DNA-binding protein n=1 Tax=Streptomyces sp. NPDC051214 TaxID=3155282 RepID=UPI00343C3ACC
MEAVEGEGSEAEPASASAAAQRVRGRAARVVSRRAEAVTLPPQAQARAQLSEPGEAQRVAAPGGDGEPVRQPSVAPSVAPSVGPLPGRVGLAVRERLPLWLQLRCGLERRSLVALLVVLAVAAVFAAQHFWAGRTQPVRAPDVVGAAPDRGAEPSPSPGVPPPTSGGGGRPVAGPGGGRIVVDVSGKVRTPGVLRMPAGSRVADALKAAGGVRPGADTEGLNRARLLVDGEQVVVGAPATAPAAPAPPGAGAVAGAAGASPAAQISLNTATAEQLDELPGVGPVLAQHIIDYRTEHGGFRAVDELREVNGIGDKRYADLQNLVRP